MNGKKGWKLGLMGWVLALSTWAQSGNEWRMTADSLILYAGQTCRYTVDTPEGEGVVSTLLSVPALLEKLSQDSTIAYRLVDARKQPRLTGTPQNGDRLEQFSLLSGKVLKKYKVGIQEAALPPVLKLHREAVTVGVSQEITLDFFAGQRTPMASVDILVPAGIDVTLDNVMVDVIGRGMVVLRELPKQSIGRTGTHYSYKQVGEVTLHPMGKRGTVIRFSGLDLRPSNGPDIRLVIKGVTVSRVKEYCFEASYTTSQPRILRSPVTVASLQAVSTIADWVRLPLRRAYYKDTQGFSGASFAWTPVRDAQEFAVLYSMDEGKTWDTLPKEMRSSDADGQLNISRLQPDRLYAFKLRVPNGPARGDSNIAWFYSGEWNAQEYGVQGTGTVDDTDKINELITRVHNLGGGIIRFPAGEYPVRTLHMKSHVWLHVDRGAVIRALPGADAPETTWFSDRAYRSGLSPTDPRPYQDPENYLTKQDVGHTFFHNTMFFGERIENVKIVGNGRITGNGNIVTTDRVMNNAPDRRCDKMFSFKLCKDIEIGGLYTGRDMWYDPDKDIPYYMDGDRRIYNDSTMLHIDQGGHFVLLATGTDGIYVHDTFFGKYNTENARDIYDFMGCNDVRVMNIYSKVSSDDIVKPGSDCSLGFTRPASGYWVRNIVGDTNCNLFQIGSETADDIQDLYVDNIYVLGANKAGFSISTNDGGHIKNVYLNSGKTGPLHSRSVMRRTRAPFFISISNRGRVLGADVEMFTFMENGVERKELLVTNANIGKVENIFIHAVDVSEVYGGSSFKKERWKPYDGSQNEAAPIIAGFKLPDTEAVKGGLTFRMPDGRHTGYIRNICFSDVDLTVKGGHPEKDATAFPPEIGVGRYNVGDLKIQPAFGFWFRHVDGMVLENCTIRTEKPDARHAVYLDDVLNAAITGLQVADGINEKKPVESVRSKNITIK